MGQHLQRHVLEGAGGAMPELQHMGLAVELPHRGNLGAVKLAAAIALDAKVSSSSPEKPSRNKPIMAAARC